MDKKMVALFEWGVSHDYDEYEPVNEVAKGLCDLRYGRSITLDRLLTISELGIDVQIYIYDKPDKIYRITKLL